mmetsp:Transcript_10483/g.11408  ORF Transcript_10483/g.11408 Transcript_10483/m.11408 type:complete len:172 (-) Transcript_10483:1034-1549(-)
MGECISKDEAENASNDVFDLEKLPQSLSFWKTREAKKAMAKADPQRKKRWSLGADSFISESTAAEEKEAETACDLRDIGYVACDVAKSEREVIHEMMSMWQVRDLSSKHTKPKSYENTKSSFVSLGGSSDFEVPRLELFSDRRNNEDEDDNNISEPSTPQFSERSQEETDF